MNPHPSITETILKHRTWRKVRKYFKQFGMTKGEQDKTLTALGIRDKIKNENKPE